MTPIWNQPQVAFGGTTVFSTSLFQHWQLLTTTVLNILTFPKHCIHILKYLFRCHVTVTYELFIYKTQFFLLAGIRQSFTFWFGTQKLKIPWDQYLVPQDILQNVVAAVVSITAATGCSALICGKENPDILRHFVSFCKIISIITSYLSSSVFLTPQ